MKLRSIHLVSTYLPRQCTYEISTYLFTLNYYWLNVIKAMEEIRWLQSFIINFGFHNNDVGCARINHFGLSGNTQRSLNMITCKNGFLKGRTIFQIFWKQKGCTKFLIFVLKTLNFGYFCIS